jgi:hypothetical protein
VDRIERDDAVGDLEFAEQPLGCGDFVGLLVDLNVRQHQSGVGVEGMQHLGCLAVGEVSKLRRSVLPSSAMARRETALAASCKRAA